MEKPQALQHSGCNCMNSKKRVLLADFTLLAHLGPSLSLGKDGAEVIAEP